MKPKHQRLLFVSASMVFLCAAALFGAQAFRENLVFFVSPTDILEKPSQSTERLRIGGLVKMGSIKQLGEGRIRFLVTDQANDVTVEYTGMLPNLFREGQGVVAEGYLTSPNLFTAQKILAKHDENYMPKDVVDALKRSDRWKEGEK